jgi:hypothetical protein
MTVTTTPATPTVTYNAGVLTSSSPTGNQWYLNGVAIAGATGQTYTPVANGVYTVKVTNNGCTSSASANVTINGVGIEELADGLFTIYPNPSSGEFNVEFEAVGGETYALTIFDEMGKLVYESTIENQSGAYAHEVKLNEVASGIYTISLKTGSLESNKKIVIKK